LSEVEKENERRGEERRRTGNGRRIF